MIVIACGMWSGVMRWIGLAYLWVRLVVGSGLRVDASLRLIHRVVVGLVVLVVMTGLCWKVRATFLQHR